MELVRGTLDVLVLKTLSWGSLHGYAVSRAIRAASEDVLQVEEGALYTALRRLEERGYVEAAWGVTDTGRDARFYTLTAAGRRWLTRETRRWERYAAAMDRVLSAREPVG